MSDIMQHEFDMNMVGDDVNGTYENNIINDYNYDTADGYISGDETGLSSVPSYDVNGQDGQNYMNYDNGYGEKYSEDAQYNNYDLSGNDVAYAADQYAEQAQDGSTNENSVSDYNYNYNYDNYSLEGNNQESSDVNNYEQADSDSVVAQDAENDGEYGKENDTESLQEEILFSDYENVQKQRDLNTVRQNAKMIEITKKRMKRRVTELTIERDKMERRALELAIDRDRAEKQARDFDNEYSDVVRYTRELILKHAKELAIECDKSKELHKKFILEQTRSRELNRKVSIAQDKVMELYREIIMEENRAREMIITLKGSTDWIREYERQRAKINDTAAADIQE